MRVAKAYSWKCSECDSHLKLPQVRHKCPVAPLPGSDDLVQWWSDPDAKPEVLVAAHHGKPNLVGHIASHKGDGVKCPMWEHHHCSEACEVEPWPDSSTWKTASVNKIVVAGGTIYPLAGTIKVTPWDGTLKATPWDGGTAEDPEFYAKQKLTKQMKLAQPVKDVPAHEKLAEKIQAIAKSHELAIDGFVALEIARAAEKLFGAPSKEMQAEMDHLQHVVDTLTTSNKHLIAKYKSSQQALHEKKMATFYQVPQPNTWTGKEWDGYTTIDLYAEPAEPDEQDFSSLASSKVLPHQTLSLLEVKGAQVHLTVVENIPFDLSGKAFDAALEKAQQTALAKVVQEAADKHLAILTTPLVSVWDDKVNFATKVQVAVLTVEQVEYPMKGNYGTH